MPDHCCTAAFICAKYTLRACGTPAARHYFAATPSGHLLRRMCAALFTPACRAAARHAALCVFVAQILTAARSPPVLADASADVPPCRTLRRVPSCRDIRALFRLRQRAACAMSMPFVPRAAMFSRALARYAVMIDVILRCRATRAYARCRVMPRKTISFICCALPRAFRC